MDYSEHQVFMHYLDNTGNFREEKISVCKAYLKNMVMYVSSVWEMMVQEFL